MLPVAHIPDHLSRDLCRRERKAMTTALAIEFLGVFVAICFGLVVLGALAEAIGSRSSRS